MFLRKNAYQWKKVASSASNSTKHRIYDFYCSGIREYTLARFH